MSSDIVITAEDMLSDEELAAAKKNSDAERLEIQPSGRKDNENEEKCVLSARISVDLMNSILEFELAYRKKHRKKLLRSKLVAKAMESYLKRETKKLA